MCGIEGSLKWDKHRELLLGCAAFPGGNGNVQVLARKMDTQNVALHFFISEILIYK